jgi:hypothetical protein
MRPDRIKHGVVSCFVTGLALAFVQTLAWGWLVAAGMALAVGIGKEVYDIRRTGFDWGDVVADVAGIGIALLLWGVGNMTAR